MSRRQRQTLAKRYARAMLVQERAYYRDIRRMYRQWLNRLLVKLSEAINSNLRLDSDPEIPNGVSAWGFLSPLFNEAVNEWKVEVQRFVIPMRNTAAKIAELSKMVWTKQRPVNLQVSPLLSEPWLETQLQDFAAENASYITKIGQDTADRIQAATVDSLKRGTGRKALQDEIRKIDSTIGETRAKTLARDQMGKLQANLTQVRAERSGVEKYEWQTVGDNRVRSKHQALDGEIREFGKGLAPGEDINCFPAGLQVDFNSPVNRFYRRWYDGELSFFVTDFSGVVESTPNHPMLTNRGWVAAKDLNIGDYLVQIHDERFFATRAKSDVQDIKPSIEDCFNLLIDSGLFADVRGGASGQFHGDGSINHDVNVISIESVLRNAIEPSFDKRFCKQFLTESFMGFDGLTSDCSFSPLLYALTSSRCGDVSFFGKLLSLVFGKSGHSNDVRLAAISQMHIVALKKFSNGVSFDADLIADFENAIATGVHLNNKSFIKLLCIMSRAVMADDFMSESPDCLAEIIRSAGNSFSDFTKIHSGYVLTYSRINNVGSKYFSGHVYNFETLSNSYEINNYTTKNCRCVAIPIVD